MQQQHKILVTGASGMIGSALVRQLKDQHYQQILTPTHACVDLTRQQDVEDYFHQQRPDYVFHLAAVVGGIHANHHCPGEFIRDNTLMHTHVIDSAYRFGAKKLLFPGSACTYPKLAPQPIAESALLSGYLEPTNVAYAAAKLNGIAMCQSYYQQYHFPAIVPMPTNAYGIGDNFTEGRSHVIPALMKRFYQAQQSKAATVTLWGTGQPLREFIYGDDVASSLIFLMQHYDQADIINVGTMQEISILALAKKIAKIVGYQGDILLDTSKPDGAKRKCLDSHRLKSLGWQPAVSLDAGLAAMFQHHFCHRDALSQIL